MRRTVLIIDGSDAMSASGEYLPNKLLAMRSHVGSFVDQYFKQSPLSLLSTVVLRDGVAHRLSPFTNDAHEILKVLELRLFLQKPSGILSIENGLRVALMELGRNHQSSRQEEEDSDGSTSALAPVNSRVVLLLGSVTVVDPGDVLALVRLIEKANIMCDVLSLVGSPNVAAQLAQCGGGTLFCPVSHAHLETIIDELATRTPSVLQQKGAVLKKVKDVEVGFPQPSSKNDLSCKCPRCHATLTNVPETCRTCGLLVCSVPHIHTAFVLANDLLPEVHPINEEEQAVEVVKEQEHCCCEMCGARAAGGVGSVLAAGFVQCSCCGALRCARCEEYIAKTLHFCPSCVTQM